jgi:hypothetical protein
VNGRRAQFTRDGDEIRITPRQSLRKGREFTVAVTYGGIPEPFLWTEREWLRSAARPERSWASWSPAYSTPGRAAGYRGTARGDGEAPNHPLVEQGPRTLTPYPVFQVARPR